MLNVSITDFLMQTTHFETVGEVEMEYSLKRYFTKGLDGPGNCYKTP